MKGLLLILLLLPCALIRAQDGRAAPVPIAVTQTWADLSNSKPVMVECFNADFPSPAVSKADSAKVSVHVGIDRDHIASDGAVLLYCLSRGVSFSRSVDQEHDLGPFRIRVINPKSLNHAQDALRQLSRAQRSSEFRDSTYVLSTQSISLGDPGTYVIELVPLPAPVLQADDLVIARIEIKVSGQPVLPWSPWSEAGTETKQIPVDADGNFIPTMAVNNPLGGIAVPKTPDEAIFCRDAPPGNTPLPQLTPDQPDPGTQLKLADNTFIVTRSDPIKPVGDIEYGYPDDAFLTRWWVNDKPFVPDPNVGHQYSRAIEEAMLANVRIKEVHFKLDFQPERLGAKKGDRIGVQVLYCSEGWKLAGNLDALRQLSVELEPNSPFPPPPAAFSFPSNRIDFIYSGDPKNVEQK